MIIFAINNITLWIIALHITHILLILLNCVGLYFSHSFKSFYV